MVCNEEKIVFVVLAKVKTYFLCDFAALVANFTQITPAMSSYVGYKWSGGRVMITIILPTCQGNCLMSYVSDGAHVTKLWCDL